MLKILLPIDGSPQSLLAVHHVLQLTRAGLPASLVLVNVQEPASLYEVVVAHDADVLTEIRRDAGADLLREAEALLEAADLPYESEVAGGSPENMVVELAENYGCDLIVMGARGAGLSEGASGLGTVAHAVLLHSPVPVTVVREPADQAAAAEPSEGDEAPQPAT